MWFTYVYVQKRFLIPTHARTCCIHTRACTCMLADGPTYHHNTHVHRYTDTHGRKSDYCYIYIMYIYMQETRICTHIQVAARIHALSFIVSSLQRACSWELRRVRHICIFFLKKSWSWWRTFFSFYKRIFHLDDLDRCLEFSCRIATYACIEGHLETFART